MQSFAVSTSGRPMPRFADPTGFVASAALVLAIAAGIAALAVGDPLLSYGLVFFAMALLLATLAAGGALVLRLARHRLRVATVMKIVAGETGPVVISGTEGCVLYRNRAAVTRFGTAERFADLFVEHLADPEAVLGRIVARAGASGQMTVHEDVVTRRGHLRLTLQVIDSRCQLWRLHDLNAPPKAERGIDKLNLPILTLGPDNEIIFANEALHRLIGRFSSELSSRFGSDATGSEAMGTGKLMTINAAHGPVERFVIGIAGQSGQRSFLFLSPDVPGAVVRRGNQLGSGGWETVEDLPVPLMKIAPGGEVLAANREARALLQMPMGPGTRMSELLEGLGRPVIDWLAEVAEGRGCQTPQFLRGTGTHQDIFVQVSLNLAGPETDPHLIAVLSDVTALKTLEAQFVQSQKMQAIGQLAGGVAHDFNNLLTAISGHCDLLLLRHDKTDPEYGDLIQIHQNANRAASLVGQLLAFSRKQNLRPEVIDLRDTLADLTHLLNRLVGEKVTLTHDHDPDLHHIRADKRQLEQVLMNLVVNARDAMPKGGEIRVETENLLLDAPVERDRATLPAGSYVVVRVVDQGTGIAPEKLPKIFEPFYTTKRPGEGTGLGLSTAYGIIKQTGGFIFADSELHKGTVFSLYFPSHDKPLAEPPPLPEPALPSLPDQAGRVVLLVEDEAPVRAFASRALRLRGYNVLEADSAEAALNILADTGLTVDVFVTDVIMPGKDGPTWVREALTARPDTKVVFVSGYAEDAFSEHQAMIPNSVFLPKPFSLTDLTTTVQRQLH